MSEKEQSLRGIPVVFTDTMPKGEIILGRIPTYEELLRSGLSFDEWCKVHAASFCKVTNLEEE